MNTSSSVTNAFSSSSLLRADPIIATQSTIAQVDEKKRPDHLKPWRDFPQLEKSILNRLHDAYHSEGGNPPRLFISRFGMREIVRNIQEGPEALTFPMVFMPLLMTIKHLQSIDAVREEFSLHPLIRITDSDQFLLSCTGADTNGEPQLALAIELMPPDKLPAPMLRRGLCQMNLRADFIDRNPAPTRANSREWEEFQAMKMVSKVAMQAFSYMIDGRIEHSIISTSEALVSLHVNLDNPRTLYYHLSEPNSDVEMLKGLGQTWLHKTAASQTLVVALLAFENAKHIRKSPKQSHRPIKLWKPDPTCGVGESTARPPSINSAYEPTSKSVSEYIATPVRRSARTADQMLTSLTLNRGRRHLAAACRPENGGRILATTPPPPGGENDNSLPLTPIRWGRRAGFKVPRILPICG
jgi:hypothetical protein